MILEPEWDPILEGRPHSGMFQSGLLVLGAGASSIRISPPLMIDEEQAECAVGILDEAMAASVHLGPMPFPLWWYRLIPFGRRSEIEGAAYLRSLGFRIVALRLPHSRRAKWISLHGMAINWYSLK